MKKLLLVCICVVLLFTLGCVQGNSGRTTIKGAFTGMSELLYKNTLYYDYAIGGNEILIPEKSKQPVWEVGRTYKVTYKTHDYSAKIITWEEIR